MATTKSELRVSSGQDCPCSGVWQALNAVLPPLLVAKGNIMPAVDGRVVDWTLLEPRADCPPGGGKHST